MKKLFLCASTLALVLMVWVAVPAQAAAPNWDVTNDYIVRFVLGGDYDHDMTLVMSGEGTIVSGGGGYPAGGPYSFAWSITNGSVSGDVITLTADYTLGAVGTTMHMTGTIAPGGTMSGTWDDNYGGGTRNGTWSTTEGAATVYDSDGDGVQASKDLCSDTSSDEWTQSTLGVNRLMWDGSKWLSKNPKGKLFMDTSVTLAGTYGCSCGQILDVMVEKTKLDFGGHYKYGCSKSVIEDWMSGIYHVGPTFVETVEVPADDADGVSNSETLEIGKDYFLRAYGTAYACDEPGCVIKFDAEYSTSDGGATPWVDGVADPYTSYGTNLLDLKVDGAFVYWGPYASSHEYQIPYAGTGSTLQLMVNDAYYPNNTGSLFVDLIEDKWVDLW